MKMLPNLLSAAAAAVAATGLAITAYQSPAQEIGLRPERAVEDSGDRPLAQGQGYEALTRGPLHEAFASPYVSDPAPGVIVPVQPPEPINEIPPGEMPAGENVVWVPGYWGWDPDEGDFLWISGVWRDVPTNRRWIPGYWTAVDEGWQWVPGFWTGAETEQLVYQPVPPETLEQGPNVAPPDGDYFWIPGCWIWQQVQYEWRPGYWAPAIADWVWTPDQYIWTPYGCVFVPGYWDYALVDRGMMFAPAHFTTAVYREPTFRFVPSIVINPAPLLIHLFVSPTYSHYYYGDYYAFQPRSPRFDFFPWYAYHDRPSLYDPLLTYYQWSYARQDVNVVQRLYSWNRYFVRNEAYRPRHTFRAQQDFLTRFDRDSVAIQPTALAFGATLPDYIESRSSQVRFREVSEPARERIVERNQALRQFQQERSRFELAATASDRREPGDRRLQPGDAERPQQALTLPESTIVGDAGQIDAIPPGRDGEPGTERLRTTPEERAAARRLQLPPRPEPGAGAETARPGDREPRDRQPGEQPDRDRPGLDRPGLDRPEQDRPGVDRPEFPDRDRPGIDPSDQDRPETPDARPEDARAGSERDRPRGPQFPRFGTGRGQLPDAGERPGTDAPLGRPDAIAPSQREGDAARPERDRPQGRSGFDPFDRLPPGVREEMTPNRPPGADAEREPRVRGRRPGGETPSLNVPDRGNIPDRGNAPGAGIAPDTSQRSAPEQPRANRPEGGQSPGRGNPNAGRPAPRPTPPQRGSQAPPNRPEAPAAGNPSAKKGNPSAKKRNEK